MSGSGRQGWALDLASVRSPVRRVPPTLGHLRPAADEFTAVAPDEPQFIGAEEAKGGSRDQ